MRTAVVAMAFASLVTVPQHDGQRSNLDTPYVSVSADGRYVALISYDRLVPADTNDRADVYVLDRADGSVALESPVSGGAVPGEASNHPALSGDGRFLVYERGDHIVWRDRVDGVETLVAAGRDPTISGDGRFVAFTSADGVMVFEVATRVTRNASVDSAGRGIPDASSAPSLSSDGRYVAFVSTAALTPDIARAQREDRSDRRRALSQVYLRDLHQGTTRILSITMDGKPADGDSWCPVISADGKTVAFVSAAANLVKGDRNHSADVFLLTLASGSIDLVSHNAKGNAANGASGRPAVSSDGQRVAFQSEASDLATPGEDINLLWDVFLFERPLDRVVRLSTDPGRGWMEASGGPSLDGAGEVVAFSSRHPMDASDRRNDFDLFVLQHLFAAPTHGAAGFGRP